MRTSDTTTTPCAVRWASTESRGATPPGENRLLRSPRQGRSAAAYVEAGVASPTWRSQMRLRRTLRPVVAATALTAAVLAVPASAGPRHPDVATASVYGLDRNFSLVGHTDLAKRGMNSPIAVAGRCVYVGDRYYSSSPDEKVRPNGGVAIIDVKNARRARQVGTTPPIGLSTQREMRADAGLGILVVEGYSPYIDGYPSSAPAAINYLKIYDIHRDCLHPRLLSTYDFGPRAPHEFFLWKDRKHPGRALAY